MHWKDWCWSWNSSTLATWCKELTHWKRPWCWERLKARGDGDDSSVQFSRSVVSDSLRPHGPQHARLPCPSPSPGLMSIESVMPSNHLILCRPLLLLPSILPSIRVFPNESALCIRWPKYWSFSFSISPPNEYSRLISFRMDWLDLLVVQGSLKSFLQCHGFNKSKYIWGVFLGGGEVAEGINLCWEDLRAVCRGSPFSVEEEREFTQNRSWVGHHFRPRTHLPTLSSSKALPQWTKLV